MGYIGYILDKLDIWERFSKFDAFHAVSCRRVYDARTSQSVGQRLSQTNLLSMFGSTRERVEYVHVRGQGDKVRGEGSIKLVSRTLR